MNTLRCRGTMGLFLAASIILASGGGALAVSDGGPTAIEIIHRANLASYYQGQDGRARVAMSITDRQGRVREREMTILRRDKAESDALEGAAYGGAQRFYVYFHRPADVRKMALVVWKHEDRDDDRWLYLPALDLVKRIAASDKRTSFVGSDFFYEDVSGRNIDADRHELVETTENYYLLRSTPVDGDSVEFSRYETYIHKASFLPVQTEYFDRNGKKYRIYKALKVDRVQGFETVVQASMEDLGSGSVTTLSYGDVRYDLGAPEDIFSERYLRRAPLEYLR